MKNDDLKNIYNDDFYKDAINNYKSAKIILEIIFKYYTPASVIDIGCGIGSWLKAVKEFGIDNIKGIDCNEIDENSLFIPRKYIDIDDLETHKNIKNERYDLLLNIEVAEHLNNQCSENFINTLISYSDVILFSAAIPYQNGTHHINCQPLQFWYDMFSKHDYICFDFRDKLMELYENVVPYYSQNLLLYVHKSKSYKFNNLKLTSRPIFYYHPQFVNYIVNQNNRTNLVYEKKIDNLTDEKSKLIKLNNKLLLNNNWFNFFTLFAISNNNEYIRVILFGIKFTFRVNENSINKISWWIPVKKWRESFRNKFKIETRPDQTRPDQTRPDQTRPDQTRPDQTRPEIICKEYIQFYNNTKTKKLQPMLHSKDVA